MARSGERKKPLIRSLDYRCVRRFRLRRLLAFLWFNNYDGAFESLSKETRVFFRVEHLQHLVRLGLWSDAFDYVFRFVPAAYLPVGGQFLVTFMRFLYEITAYEPTDPSTFPAFDPYGRHEVRRRGGVNPGGVKLAQIIRSVCSEEAWGSINWPLVRFKAADVIGDLVAQIPEFDEMRRLPHCPTRPANVLPVGLSSRGRSGLHKKSLGRMPANALARSFLSKKRMHSSSQGANQSCLPLEPLTMIRLAGIIDECLQAGKREELNDKLPIESSCAEGTEHTMVTEAVIRPDSIARNNPKRPRPMEHQEVNTGKRQITEELGQRSIKAYCSLGDKRVQDVGSDMKSWSARSGDCSSPTEIPSS
ncbi:unnamed protein product [Urochloa humidicola]